MRGICLRLTAIVCCTTGGALFAFAAGSPAEPEIAASLATISGSEMLAHVATLAADDFEGRMPGTRGEARTVAYISGEFRRLGLAPGNPDGTYLQAVPLNSYRAQPSLTFAVGRAELKLGFPDDFIAVSYAARPKIEVRDSDIVFVGYGVVAPEYAWDDYKGSDLRGKTLLMLINDPPVPDPKDPSRLDDSVFGGKAMTYYGRWTYKYEMAVRQGAAAAIIIHETGPAAYPYSTVVNSWGKQNFALRSAAPNPDFPPIAAWMTTARAEQLLAATGHSLAALKAAAVRRDFRPVALPASASFSVANTWHAVDSHNVVGRLAGSDPALRAETVIYSAHWDHFGWDPQLPGSKHEQIYHGALDNASGVAALFSIAKAYKAAARPPRRSVLFIATTAEERGLLGARYYARHPLYPLAHTLADINIDGVNTYGRTRDIEVLGAGKSTLEELLATAAATQGRIVKPDHRTELGFFYRADQLEFAKAGVPVLMTDTGSDFIGRAPGYADERMDAYIAHDYHQVTDTVRDDWDMSGAVENAALLFRVGYGLAQGGDYPVWKPGTEFKAVRERSLATSGR